MKCPSHIPVGLLSIVVSVIYKEKIVCQFDAPDRSRDDISKMRLKGSLMKSVSNTGGVETISVKNWVRWTASQLGQIVIAVGLLSLIFNYAYRFTIDRNVSSPLFYLTTIVLGFIVFLLVRRDYFFVLHYQFYDTGFRVRTLFGGSKDFALTRYKWVPALHKVVNIPEKSASLSFYVQDRKTGKNVRNYSWSGFSKEDFQRISARYGYGREVDFKQSSFGRP